MYKYTKGLLYFKENYLYLSSKIFVRISGKSITTPFYMDIQG